MVIAPTDAYIKRRTGTIADILMPKASTFTNKIDTDTTLITKQRLVEPEYIIKFRKNTDSWYTVWDGNIIKKWNGEKKKALPMRPYLDELYTPDAQKRVIELFDSRALLFTNLITFKQFQKELWLLKPRGK